MSRIHIAGAVLLMAALAAAQPTWGQGVEPASIGVGDASPVCNDASDAVEACITLPPDAIINKVDVFFLFDDTGSFAGFVPTVTSIFSSLVADLETALPGVEFGFGVGRFEDYGGPGTGFSGEFASGRPFILNQPIVTAADAGGAAARDMLINSALARTAAGFGGDGPESSIAEGLYQVATGAGFDGDGDGLTTGIGGAQIAGANASQVSADNSGDVPAFSTLDPAVVKSGTFGGAGFRDGVLRLVILATDICSIAAFDATAGIPATITGSGSTELVEDFACSSVSPGSSRFGFVSDAKTSGGNTISGAVVPSGAGTVPATIAALNAAGIRVLGMGPSATPQPSGSGPSSGPEVFLSALARLTGAVDEDGDPLVFSIGGGGTPLKDAIVGAITTTATLPVDIALNAAGTVPSGLTVSFDPTSVADVPPGGEACFDVTLSGSGSPSGAFALEFSDQGSGAVLGSIPVTVGCIEGGCASAPRTGCKTAGKSLLLYKDRSPNTKDKLIFKWLNGAATTQDELADPEADAEYNLCVYAGGDALALEATVPASNSKWAKIGTKGYKFKDAAGADAGTQKIVIKGGAANKSKLLWKGKGDNLPDLGAVTLPFAYPIVAQVVNGGTGVCFEATFDAADAKKNVAGLLKVKH